MKLSFLKTDIVKYKKNIEMVYMPILIVHVFNLILLYRIVTMLNPQLAIYWLILFYVSF